jgi:hypothetical protein
LLDLDREALAAIQLAAHDDRDRADAGKGARNGSAETATAAQ